MSNVNLRRWVLKFRKDAEAHNYALFREHLRKLGLPDSPELLLEGTIEVVITCAAYASIDNQSIAASLNMQQYDPAKAIDARYAFTVDLCGKAFARLLVEKKGAIPDLADLSGYPWQDYKVCGYHDVFIARTNNKKLGSRELARLEREVTYDLRFDYCEEDLDLWLDDQSIEGVLKVSVQDHVV